MTKPLILLLSILFIQCISPNKVNEPEFYFDVAQLDNLSLDSLQSFWNGCSLYIGSSYPGNYCFHSGHIDSRTCFSIEAHKRLGVAVFANPTLAFEAVNANIKNDTSVKSGDSANSKTWWIYDQKSGNRFGIIYLKFNTVIEASQNAPSIELAQDSMWSAINEIEHRIQLFANTSPPATPRDKHFNSTNLGKLKISNLTGFWQGDSLNDSLNRMDDCNTPRHEGFLHSISYGVNSTSSGMDKFISVSVYETTDQAILGIYAQRTYSSGVICYGDPDDLVKGVWFYICSSGTPYSDITFQKWNTIVDIRYYPQNYEIITNAVKEMARRVDELSK